MEDKILDKLVARGTISGYNYYKVDCDGNIGEESEHDNSEILEIHFTDGQVLKIEPSNSGWLNNLALVITEG